MTFSIPYGWLGKVMSNRIEIAKKIPKEHVELEPVQGNYEGLIFFWRFVEWEGGRFYMPKFRTMFRGADKYFLELAKKNGMTDKGKIMNEIRVCNAFMQLLRDTRGDELPRFYNLFRGELDIAGSYPRSRADYMPLSPELRKLAWGIKPGVVPVEESSDEPQEIILERYKFDLARASDPFSVQLGYARKTLHRLYEGKLRENRENNGVLEDLLVPNLAA